MDRKEVVEIVIQVLKELREKGYVSDVLETSSDD